MIVIQFVLGRDSRTPVAVNIQHESAAVAMNDVATVINGYVKLSTTDDEDDDDDEEGGSGFGPGSFNIN